MTTSTSTSAPTRGSAVSLGTALRTGAVAGVIAGVTNVVISSIAGGLLGASDDFVPLTPGPVLMWTILGAIIGAVGWRLIVNTSAHSRALLNTLVPIVLSSHSSRISRCSPQTRWPGRPPRASWL